MRIIALITTTSLAIVACQKEALQTPTSTYTNEAVIKNSNIAAKKEVKPGRYIKASEDLIIPAAVSVPEGSIRIATYYAEGVQQYKAQEIAGSPGMYLWAFVGPEADLYAHNNHFAGTHGAGPFWALSPADSIIGQHFSPARTAPSPDAGSIDWLLLKPKAGTTPTGVFKDVQYIQRIATIGGKAPSILPVRAGEIAEVKYVAVYRFSRNP